MECKDCGTNIDVEECVECGKGVCVDCTVEVTPYNQFLEVLCKDCEYNLQIRE